MKKYFIYPLQSVWAPILTAGVAVFAIWIAISYANQPLLESYGFRQTQTALTSYWMIHDGWKLAYETPVGGYPWAIPFEFPIYQSIVALIAWLGNFQLDLVGRLVSFFFLLACAWPAFATAHRLNLPSQVAWIFCALLWSNPIYLLWGRSFMIETAAVFFTFAAIPYALDLSKPCPRWQSAFLFILFSTMGMLQKVTTAGPAFLIIAFILIVIHFKNFGFQLPPLRQFIYVVVAFSVPLIVGIVWAKYSDLVKMHNIFGTALTSKALIKWNFGTIEQRLDFNVLKIIFWERYFINNVAGSFVLVLLGGALFLGERRIRVIVLSCLILFAAPLLIFINLHFIHEYYQTSCVFFFIGAISVATVSFRPARIGKCAISPIVTMMLITSNLIFFSLNYAKYLRIPFDNSRTATLAVSDVIRRYTPQKSGIVVFGDDWNSEFAYYSQRKSFTVPKWFKEYDSVWKDPAKFLGDRKLGALVFTGSENILNNILKNPIVQTQPDLFKVLGCFVWLPNVKSIMIPGENHATLPMDFIDNNTNFFPEGYTEGRSIGFDGSIDIINGIFPAPKKLEASGFLSIEGWLAVSAKNGIVPDDIFVTLIDSKKRIKYYKCTHRKPRNDVKVFYNHPEMPDVGFTSTIDLRGVRGDYVLGLAIGYKGNLEQCNRFNIPIKIGMLGGNL
jgi:hypothetical protein